MMKHGTYSYHPFQDIYVKAIVFISLLCASVTKVAIIKPESKQHYLFIYYPKEFLK